MVVSIYEPGGPGLIPGQGICPGLCINTLNIFKRLRLWAIMWINSKETTLTLFKIFTFLNFLRHGPVTFLYRFIVQRKQDSMGSPLLEE